MKNEKDARLYRGWANVPRCRTRQQEVHQAVWVLAGVGVYLLTWAVIVVGMNV